MGIIYLSPSKLNLFRECPRCFHDAYTSDTPRPRGIMASLPGGMDLIMKKYVDQFRGKLPPGLEGKLPGVLFNDMATMKRWRFWKTGPSWRDEVKGIILIGALDDCLVDGDIYIPLDWKTKGSEPKDDGSQYYQTQLDCYNLMLEYTGKQVRDEGWLVYIWPVFASIYCADDMAPRPIQPSDKDWFDVTFEFKPFKLTCSRERAKEIIYKAAECLRGSRPKPSESCEHCKHLEDLKQLQPVISLNGAEAQSGLSRVAFAEGLIKQLPTDHDGRNTWLMNYGQSDESKTKRADRGLTWDEETLSAKTVKTN